MHHLSAKQRARAVRWRQVYLRAVFDISSNGNHAAGNLLSNKKAERSLG